jgi:Na+-translocating membrane potential-generating system (MpsC)
LIAIEALSCAGRWRSGSETRKSGVRVSDEGDRRSGHLALAISNAVVRELASTTGRGPTQARTTLGENGVFVVLQDTLTRGERTLVAAGEIEAVLDYAGAGSG